MSEPIFRNPKVIIFGEISVDEGTKCVYIPWVNRASNVFGWSAEPAVLQAKQYLYISPDLHAPGETPRFYLYIGPHGDPAKDRRLGPYFLEDGNG